MCVEGEKIREEVEKIPHSLREAHMLEAVGLSQLSNQKRGEFHGQSSIEKEEKPTTNLIHLLLCNIYLFITLLL